VARLDRRGRNLIKNLEFGEKVLFLQWYPHACMGVAIYADNLISSFSVIYVIHGVINFVKQ
jgi:hypothetical protein